MMFWYNFVQHVKKRKQYVIIDSVEEALGNFHRIYQARINKEVIKTFKSQSNHFKKLTNFANCINSVVAKRQSISKGSSYSAIANFKKQQSVGRVPLQRQITVNLNSFNETINPPAPRQAKNPYILIAALKVLLSKQQLFKKMSFYELKTRSQKLKLTLLKALNKLQAFYSKNRFMLLKQFFSRKLIIHTVEVDKIQYVNVPTAETESPKQILENQSSLKPIILSKFNTYIKQYEGFLIQICNYNRTYYKALESKEFIPPKSSDCRQSAPLPTLPTSEQTYQKIIRNFPQEGFNMHPPKQPPAQSPPIIEKRPVKLVEKTPQPVSKERVRVENSFSQIVERPRRGSLQNNQSFNNTKQKNFPSPKYYDKTQFKPRPMASPHFKMPLSPPLNMFSSPIPGLSPPNQMMNFKSGPPIVGNLPNSMPMMSNNLPLMPSMSNNMPMMTGMPNMSNNMPIMGNFGNMPSMSNSMPMMGNFGNNVSLMPSMSNNMPLKVGHNLMNRTQFSSPFGMSRPVDLSSSLLQRRGGIRMDRMIPFEGQGLRRSLSPGRGYREGSRSPMLMRGEVMGAQGRVGLQRQGSLQMLGGLIIGDREMMHQSTLF